VRLGRKVREGGGRGSVRVIACIVARPLEQPVGVGFSRQTLPGDFELLVAVKRDGGTRILDGSGATRRGQNVATAPS